MEKSTLWMGDLEPWMNENWIKALWLKHGEIVNVKMIKDRSTGQAAGYCFVEFSNSASASRALTTLNGSQIPGTVRIFKLNWASGSNPTRDACVEYTIYVSDVPVHINDYQLFAYFQARFPSCRGAKIVLDPLTQLSKGYGFVRFADESEQQRALMEMNGQEFAGSIIRCAPAQTKIIGGAHAGMHYANASSAGGAMNAANYVAPLSYAPTYAMNYDPNYYYSYNPSAYYPQNYSQPPPPAAAGNDPNAASPSSSATYHRQ